MTSMDYLSVERTEAEMNGDDSLVNVTFLQTAKPLTFK